MLRLFCGSSDMSIDLFHAYLNVLNETHEFVFAIHFKAQHHFLNIFSVLTASNFCKLQFLFTSFQ